MNIAVSECLRGNEATAIHGNMQQLRDCGLLESNRIKFKYKKMTQYYLSQHLSKKAIQIDDIVNQTRPTSDHNDNVYCAYKLLYTNCESVKKVAENIIELARLLNSADAEASMPINRFVRECIFDIIHENEDLFTTAIEGFSIDKLCDNIKYIIISAAKIIKTDENFYKVLGHFSLDSKLKFSSFLFFSDRLCEKLHNYSDVTEISFFSCRVRLY